LGKKEDGGLDASETWVLEHGKTEMVRKFESNGETRWMSGCFQGARCEFRLVIWQGFTAPYGFASWQNDPAAKSEPQESSWLSCGSNQTSAL
jgi:hypothetical protein